MGPKPVATTRWRRFVWAGSSGCKRSCPGTAQGAVVERASVLYSVHVPWETCYSPAMRLLVVALLLSGAPRLVAAADGSSATPSLAGHWLFNATKSDDAREKMRQVRGNRGGPEPPMNGAFFSPAAAELTIAQTADVVTILVKDGAILEIHPNGKIVHHGGGTSSTQWTRDGLFTDVQPARGARRTKTLSISNGGKELIEVSTLESRWGPVTVRHVYDAVRP